MCPVSAQRVPPQDLLSPCAQFCSARICHRQRHHVPLPTRKVSSSNSAFDVVPVRAGHALDCLCRFRTDGVDVTADVQKARQHSIHHGTAVRSQSQSVAFSEYSWHFGQCSSI
eukprot:9496838-Pyramimonas_sp.AAC.1